MPKRILVADDEVHIRRALELKLRGAGYDVTAVANGSAALETAKKILPHVLVSDYQMPGALTGVDVIREMRQTPGLVDIPVILLTGSVAIVERLKSALPGAGRVTYMAKPFSPRALLREIQLMLGEQAQQPEA